MFVYVIIIPVQLICSKANICQYAFPIKLEIMEIYHYAIKYVCDGEWGRYEQVNI